MASGRFIKSSPDLLVFVRAFGAGLLVCAVFRLSRAFGTLTGPAAADTPFVAILGLLTVSTLIVVTYVWLREGHSTGHRLLTSFRFDVMVALILGACSSALLTAQFQPLDRALARLDPTWPYIILMVLLLFLLSPIWRHLRAQRNRAPVQLRFVDDLEIEHKKDDILKIEDDAISFAESVMACGGNSTIVFGVDGPWGIGKSSFMRIAEQHWRENAADSLIVFRFEPLRYASEPDLAAKLIRDLTATLQKKVYAPEFPQAVSRYSRMLKGKAEVSFLGFNISLEPTSETVDEVLESIDDVLFRLRKRLVLVIDDLDRLDPTSINNVLFAIRRTYNLTQATYILCYDTEVLAPSGDDSLQMRQFLEKFITVKISLFIDRKSLCEFLRHDWKSDPTKFPSIPSTSMHGLSRLCEALAAALEGEHAAMYLLLAGDLRKVKRFVNAALMVRLEQLNHDRSDFDPSDLVNLMLLHLHYPGLFRLLYAQETFGLSGAFSARRGGRPGERQWRNSDKFKAILEGCPDGPSRFLLEQLFDVEVLGLNETFTSRSESFYRARACFNEGVTRNLEDYLQLLVRFKAPEEQGTFKLYKSAVDEVLKGSATAESVLKRPVFHNSGRHNPLQQFWRVLVSQAYGLKRSLVGPTIDALVNTLPRCTVLGGQGFDPRIQIVYSLAQLLEAAGWDRKKELQSPDPRTEIAVRILGRSPKATDGLIGQLAEKTRGVLGWNDLMSFRMVCSLDRGGQLHNVASGLVKYEDPSAPTDGLVAKIVQTGMRKFSQAVFRHFEASYIAPGINFLTHVDETDDTFFLGDLAESAEALPLPNGTRLDTALKAARNHLKGYVVYQLGNNSPPSRSGIGCGFYDPEGAGDNGGIAQAISTYLFDFCFNVQLDFRNAHHFSEYCLRNLQNSFFTGSDEEGFVVTEAGLVGGLNRAALIQYWRCSAEAIRAFGLTDIDREVVTTNYMANYKDDLVKVFGVLDQMVTNEEQPASNHAPIPGEDQ